MEVWEYIHAAGHRVVHGGELFKESVVITDEVLKGIEDCIDLAPLHNPNNLRGIRALREIFGQATPQVAVFDTAFHTSIPEYAYLLRLATIFGPLRHFNLAHPVWSKNQATRE